MKKITIKCPTCKNELNLELEEYVNATRNEDVKRRVIMRRIFEARCPKCHSMHFVNHPFLYRDDERKILYVLASPNLDVDKFVKKQGLHGNYKREYTLRVCYDLNQLIEKVLLAEYKINDKTMEVVKLFYYMEQHNREIKMIYFEGIEKGKIRFACVLQNKRQITAYCDLEALSRIESINKKTLKAKLNDWELVDGKWASEFYNNNEEKINEIGQELNKEAEKRKKQLEAALAARAKTEQPKKTKGKETKKATPKKETKKAAAKPAVKKAAPKKEASKKVAKPETKKAAPKKETKKAVAKPAVKKAAPKKEASKKIAKPETKKAAAKNEAAKKTTAKPVAKKETKKTTTKTATKKAAPKKEVAKKTAAKPATKTTKKETKTETKKPAAKKATKAKK